MVHVPTKKRHNANPVRKSLTIDLLPKSAPANYTSTSVQTVATDQNFLQGRIMRLALASILALLTGCAESRLNDGLDLDSRTSTTYNQIGTVQTEGRRTLYEQAREGLRQSRERYVATTRPVLERKFRLEHPELTEMEIEAMVNEALANGPHPETEPRPDGPARLPPPRPANCLPPPGSWPSNPNCY